MSRTVPGIGRRGGGRRRPELIPETFVPELERLSKSDLMEIAFDYAKRCTGKDDEMEAFNDLMQTARILKHAREVAQ